MSEALVSQGSNTTVIYFTEMPWVLDYNTVPGGENAVIREQTFDVRLPRAVRPRFISTFIGLDQGNLGEFAIDILTGDRDSLYRRSMHKEVRDNYDAWDRRLANPDFKIRNLNISLLGHATGARGRVHFEVVIEH